ncbi:hypothetical protein AGABI2DRAFT_196205 [Agaricus bisporus var. bisporus H97]|uniref:hypothetical protein n=1 Tax=Agaricus bisporus var. bisporus (strain H97 / ATCC MYA-4626 / FGSC 10389) TaxID=936046 RepID=UPI00029F589E|nr:hypothetical protein AGABI2DRAFT_196205 [Agaricus bisporus var. bisporus H97]EKV41708.1 hypothetical protein AGABI2DRAFT_196205 [Agaricus bisporus var. bisporus H97]
MHPIAPELFHSEDLAALGDDEKRERNVSAKRDALHGYPRGTEREKYRTKDGRLVTAYQWAVYDFILQIPKGQVTTYKIVSDNISGSAQSVGTALKRNPFSPYIPCHRIVTSNLFIGGFFGKRAGQKSQGDSKKKVFKLNDEPPEIKRKIAYLRNEGVEINSQGFLVDHEIVWRPSVV